MSSSNLREIESLMPRINDRCITIFREASGSVLENFTVPELADLDKMAQEIEAIIKAAQRRQQDALNKDP